MNRDFLKEAIADAKAVKESAIANAKVALEEAFSPQVQAMFASKLEEMEKEDKMEEEYKKDVDEAKKDDDKMEEEMSNPVMRRGLKGDGPAEKETERMRFKEEKDDMDEEMKKDMDEEMKKDLDEAYSTIETLRSDLNEINLLNAKLLYTNKIFKSKNLNENDKVKVLTNFDKATTVKEAKLIYDTLKDLKPKAKKRSIKESIGRASKSAGLAPNKSEKKPIVESNQMVDRFKKLAGII